MKNFTRRSAVALGVMGVASLFTPTLVAFANDGEDAKTNCYMPDVPLSDNPMTNTANQEAMRKWRQAVEQAISENSEIISITCPSSQIMPRWYISAVASKPIGYAPYGAELAVNASYEGLSSGYISVVYDINSYANWGCSAQHVTGSCALIDNKRTLAANYTTLVTWSPGTPFAWSETIATYAEFYADGSCWAV